MSSCLEVLFLKPHLNRNPVSWIGSSLRYLLQFIWMWTQ